MAATRKLALVLLVTALASGCGGWYLRGNGPHQAAFKSAFVNAPSAYLIGDAVKRELYNRAIAVVATRGAADIIIDIERASFDRRVLSVDADTGKVREIELGLEAYFSVRTRDGRLLVTREPLNWQLDYVFDEVSLLGTVEQDQTAQYDLAKIAATTLVLRLQAIEQLPPAAAPSTAAPVTARATAAAAAQAE